MRRFALFLILVSLSATLSAQTPMSESADTLVRTGILNVEDAGNAVGATVYLDGQPIGVVPLVGYRAPVGDHTITYAKKGVISQGDGTPIHILENRATTTGVGTGRYGRYRIVTNPEQAEITLDGASYGKTPWEGRLPEGKHVLRIESPGLVPFEEPVVVKKGGDLREISFDLTRMTPLTIDCEEDSLVVVVLQGKAVISEGKKTPAKVTLPLSDKDYTLRIYRPRITHPIYWGPMRFRDEGKTEHRVRTHSNYQFHVITVDLPVFDSRNKRVAFFDPQLELFRCSFFPGLTFPLVKARAFCMEERPTIGSLFRENGVRLGVNVLTNAEFRLGGGITDWLDIAALGTFSWYPDWSDIVPALTEKIPSLSTGYDYFAGVEVSSRIPVILGKVKAGCQWYDIQGLPEFRNKPFFVVSLGFSLGDRGSWGENIIRLF